MNSCAKSLRESIPIQDMRMLYTCAIDDVEKMQRGFECFDEGDTHYRSATPLSHLTSKEKGRGRWKLLPGV